MWPQQPRDRAQAQCELFGALGLREWGLQGGSISQRIFNECVLCARPVEISVCVLCTWWGSVSVRRVPTPGEKGQSWMLSCHCFSPGQSRCVP